MTLVLSVNGPEVLWMVADRRLTYRGGVKKDSARKLMFLETSDGVAIVGYSGLGATAAGTEPADWMSSVLRGRNLPLEQSLGVLADAMKRQFPLHLMKMPVLKGAPPAHTMLVAAFQHDRARIYTIDLMFDPSRTRYLFRYTRHVNNEVDQRTPRIGVAGSGAAYLIQQKRWRRELLRTLKAYDAGQITPNTVADHFAALNYEVHSNTSDKSVGPSCIVAWRPKKDGNPHKYGGGHQFYTGTSRDPNCPSLPTIANGMDVDAIIGAMQPFMLKQIEALRQNQPVPELDAEMNSELARLPQEPDENLT